MRNVAQQSRRGRTALRAAAGRPAVGCHCICTKAALLSTSCGDCLTTAERLDLIRSVFMIRTSTFGRSLEGWCAAHRSAAGGRQHPRHRRAPGAGSPRRRVGRGARRNGAGPPRRASRPFAYAAQIVSRRSSTLTATFCPRSKPARRNHLPPSRSSGTWCSLR